MPSLTDNNAATLSLLEKAINDVGYWSYWSADFPQRLQLEFSRVQLWNPPLEEGEPPSSRIAIILPNPLSVTFLTFPANPSTPPTWPELMVNDALSLPRSVFVTFNNRQEIEQTLSATTRKEHVFGFSSDDKQCFTTQYQCLVNAGSIGILVCSNDTPSWRNHTEENLSLADVVIRNQQWWDYWKIYWDSQDTDHPLPADPTCEATIPAGQ